MGTGASGVQIYLYNGGMLFGKEFFLWSRHYLPWAVLSRAFTPSLSILRALMPHVHSLRDRLRDSPLQPGRGYRLMDGRILTLFAVAGGALGMLLALMIFTRNHMNKHNIAWWFSAIVFLIVWVLVVLVWAGVIVVDLEPGASFNAPVIVALGAYLLAINVITFAVFLPGQEEGD